MLDRRDTYVGQQVTIFDNRGTCAHSALLGPALGPRFGRSGAVRRPGGGRMDEIIAAVGRALGRAELRLGGHEAREQVDQEREQAIEVSKDGPYRSRAGSRSRMPTATWSGGTRAPRSSTTASVAVPLAEQAVLQRQAGRSARDPVPDPEHEPTLFEAGGLPALTRMTRIFYGQYVPQIPSGSAVREHVPDHPERVAAWLGEGVRRPKAYSEGYGGYERMVSQHLGKAASSAPAGSSCCASRPTTPSRRRRRVARRVRRLPGVGLADRARELPARRPSAAAHAGAALVVVLRRDAEQAGLRPGRRGAGAAGRPSWPDELLSFEQHIKPPSASAIVSRCASPSTSGRRRRRRARRHPRPPPGRDDALRRAWPEERVEVSAAGWTLARPRRRKELRNVRNDRHLESRQPQARPRPCFEPGCVRADGLADRLLVVGAHPSGAREFVEHGYEVDVASPDGGRLQGDSWSDPHDKSGYSADDLTSRSASSTRPSTEARRGVEAARSRTCR